MANMARIGENGPPSQPDQIFIGVNTGIWLDHDGNQHHAKEPVVLCYSNKRYKLLARCGSQRKTGWGISADRSRCRELAMDILGAMGRTTTMHDSFKLAEAIQTLPLEWSMDTREILSIISL